MFLLSQQMFLEKIYGKCLPINKTSNPATQIIESAAMLKLQQQQKIQQIVQKTPEKMDASSRSLFETSADGSRLTNGSTSTPGTPFKVSYTIWFSVAYRLLFYIACFLVKNIFLFIALQHQVVRVYCNTLWKAVYPSDHPSICP